MTPPQESIWIVCAGWDYEGEQVYGAFSTEERAREAVVLLSEATRPPGDWLAIYATRIDGPPRGDLIGERTYTGNR